MNDNCSVFIEGRSEDLERLMFEFGKARRRAYSMKQKGIGRLEIIRRLRADTGLHSRYVWTAYEMIKALPPHVTFGGLKLQRLRESGKITKDEYRRRRNSVLACLGQALFKGNLCLRVVGDELRANVAPRKWIRLPLCIPKRYEKYRSQLDGSRPYTVLVKRRVDGRGYDAKITVEVGTEIPEPKRVMALDLNAGHIDFAVVERRGLEPVAFGKINCHKLLTCRKEMNKLVVHKTVNKIRNVAKHYKAGVVAGKLRTLTMKGQSRANRKTHRMSQFGLRRVMKYKLPMSGLKYSEKSEAHTSKVGEILSQPLGLDIHKASAYAFAVKVLDYNCFKFLRGVASDEGDGIPRRGLSGGSGFTVLRQSLRLAHDEAKAEATPQFMGLGGGTGPFKATILHVKV